MKKLIIAFFLLGQSLFIFSQTTEDCEGRELLVLSGELENYELEDNCVTSVEITTLNEDTLMEGITFIDAESVHIIPTEGYKINIKPESIPNIDPNDLDLQIVIAPRTTKGNTAALKPSSTIIDIFPNSEQSVLPAKIEVTKINIYPNPVQIALTIEADEIITGYKITDLYGRIYLEENAPNSNTITVKKLPIGVYFIIIQTQNKTVAKSFIKN